MWSLLRSIALAAFSCVPRLPCQAVRCCEARIFEEIDHNGDSEICWNDFQKWLLRWNVPHDDSEDAARSLFTFLDRDGSGRIDAQEMMDALMLLSEFESKLDGSLSVARLLKSTTLLQKLYWILRVAQG